MRSDMAKVVTERPRDGGGYSDPKGYRKELHEQQKVDFEDAPKREKIRQKWKTHFKDRADGGKEFTDLLGPLHRCLLKQVGRPWAKVYSEICQTLPKNSVSGSHIRDHVDQFVEQNVVMIGKVPHYSGGPSYRSGVIYSYGKYKTMYVNPDNGLLCLAKEEKKDTRKQDERLTPGIPVYKGLQYHKVDGVWYEVTTKPFNADPANIYSCWTIKDEVLRREYYSEVQLRQVYNGLFIAVSKRQLSKKEIRAASLA